MENQEVKPDEAMIYLVGGLFVYMFFAWIVPWISSNLLLVFGGAVVLNIIVSKFKKAKKKAAKK